MPSTFEEDKVVTPRVTTPLTKGITSDKLKQIETSALKRLQLRSKRKKN